LYSHSISISTLTSLWLSLLLSCHARVNPVFVALAHSLLVGEDPPEKFFRIKLVVRVLISLLKHAEDLIHDKLVVDVNVEKVEETVVAINLPTLGLNFNDKGLEGTTMVLPADKWQFLGAGEVVPLTLFILGRSAVNYRTFSARLLLLLIPGKVVSAGVVHPLVLALLSYIVHPDPVSLVIVTTNQSAD